MRGCEKEGRRGLQEGVGAHCRVCRGGGGGVVAAGGGGAGVGGDKERLEQADTYLQRKTRTVRAFL